ncbi:MAG TPA: hypothetical protein VKF80_07890 [Candidatus Eisenbacteria bacterium]|nr:hypothetical protein [Candidatus Eisenbacteria bacterium]
MKRTWWVALLFLLPSLALTLLLNSALFLQRGMDAPIVWGGVIFLPFVATGGSVRGAFARGLGVLALLSLLFVLVVYLRIWTEAGKAVLEREGLLTLSHWAIALVVLGALGALLLSRAPGPKPAS